MPKLSVMKLRTFASLSSFGLQVVYAMLAAATEKSTISAMYSITLLVHFDTGAVFFSFGYTKYSSIRLRASVTDEAS